MKCFIWYILEVLVDWKVSLFRLPLVLCKHTLHLRQGKKALQSWKKVTCFGASMTFGAICPWMDLAPLKMTPALSGMTGPKTLSFLRTPQCFASISLICLDWTEYVVKKDHRNLSSVAFFGRTSRSELRSKCRLRSISASSSPTSYPFSTNLSFRTVDWAIKSSVLVQFRLSRKKLAPRDGF